MWIIDRLFRRECKDDPATAGSPAKDPNQLYKRALYLFSQRDFRGAAQILEKTASLAPNSAEVHFTLGATYSRVAGEYGPNEERIRPWAKKSAECFRKAVKLASHHAGLNQKQLSVARDAVAAFDRITKTERKQAETKTDTRCSHKNTGEQSYFCTGCGQQLRTGVVPESMKLQYCVNDHQGVRGLKWCAICGKWLREEPEPPRQTHEGAEPWETYAQFVSVPSNASESDRSDNMRFQFMFSCSGEAGRIISSLPDNLRSALPAPQSEGFAQGLGPDVDGKYVVWYEDVSLTIGEGKELLNRVVEAGGEIYEAFVT